MNLFESYNITIYLPTFELLIIWVVVGLIISSYNLYEGIQRGMSLHKWYLMVPLFLALSVIWPLLLAEIIKTINRKRGNYDN